MLLTDTFSAYCKNLNNNMGAAVEYMLTMDKKYNRIFKLQEQILRQRFTTNTKDDYTEIPWVKAPLDRQPFVDMVRLIVQQNLLPNFFKKETQEYIQQSIAPAHKNLGENISPYVLLHNLLVWSTFDEAAYLNQKKQMSWREQEEARIKQAAEKYRRHQLAVQTGKEQMAKIASDPKMTERFLLGSHWGKINSKRQDQNFAAQEMQKIKNNLALRTAFETSFKR